MLLRRALVACHVLLIGTIVAGLLQPPSAVRVAFAALAALPLLLTLRGVARERRGTLQRLAVLLVAYIGGLSVEVVAHSGAAALFNAALLTAVLELSLALALIRRSRPPFPRARE
jgi:uncharacterized membrane protein